MRNRRIVAALLVVLAVVPLAANFERGVALYNRQNYWDAKAAFRQVLTTDKGHLPANAYLASCLYRLKQYKPILDYFPEEIRKRTISLNNPDQKKFASMLLKQIAFACMQTGQSKRAIVALGIANKLVSNDPSIYNTLGLAYLKTGKYRLAEISFQTAVHLVPSNYFYHNNLGAAYLELGTYREALKCFERAVRINWDYHNGWDNVWVAREKLGVTSHRGWKSFSYFTTTGGGNPDQGDRERDARLKREREAKLRRERERKEREERDRREARRKKEEARRKAEADRKKQEAARRKAEAERRRREAAERARKAAGSSNTRPPSGDSGASGGTTGGNSGTSGGTTTPPGGDSGSTNR